MTGDLITFPIRLGLRAARFGLHASGRAVSVVSFLVKSASGGGSDDDAVAYAPASTEPVAPNEQPSPPAREQSSPPAREQSSPPAREQSSPPAREQSSASQDDQPAADDTQSGPVQPEPAATPSPSPAVPEHVSEQPTLVEEFAEPGAEDGAGAQVNIAEPWDGYSRMNAQDVIERAPVATPAELAAVLLFEAAHRSRQTVLAAVERELRAKSGQGAASTDQTRKEPTNGG